MYSALYTFSNYQLLDFLSKKGLEYKVELDQKVYTKSDTAEEVINIFKNELNDCRVKVLYNTKVCDFIVEEDEIKGIITEQGKKILGDKIIITTGGKEFS